MCTRPIEPPAVREKLKCAGLCLAVLAVAMLMFATYHLARDMEAAEAVLQNDPRLVHRTLVTRRPQGWISTALRVVVQPQLRAEERQAIHCCSSPLTLDSGEPSGGDLIICGEFS